MNVALDLGNTLIKVGIFEGRDLRKKEVFETASELKTFLTNFSGSNAIISSVSNDAAEVREWITGFDRVLLLTPQLSVPVQNRYASPETLGVDRLAAVCGARDLFPGRNCLVISMGTCITYDLVDNGGQYHGGAISPGFMMRFKAMKTFTARLPLVDPVESPPLLGRDTISCMQSGVVWGVTDEIEGRIRRYEEIFPELQVILTGGDGQFFENKLKASIFAVPELVLRGLNSILLHNVSE